MATSANSRLRILVLGYIVRGPLAGLVWHHLQYVLGLIRLGHEVYYVEDSDDYPSCYDPIQAVTTTDPGYGLRFARGLFAGAGLGGHWCYYDAHAARWYGPLGGAVEQLAPTCDIVLNLSGITPLRSWIMAVPVRVYVDTDPVFTQIKILTEQAARERALRHTRFFSFGELLARGGALAGDLPWRATRQPIVVDAWPVTPPPSRGYFTSVFQWQSYAAPTFAGVRYGMKADSFIPYIDVPSRTGCTFELALAGAAAPRELLLSHGWRLRDPGPLSRSPWTYRQYIQRSLGEFSVAKAGYVVSQCGWFSERSACYLASGRPSITQDTGFSAVLPVGEGLLSFTAPDEAVIAVEAVVAKYRQHARAARAIAEAYFDSEAVLTRLLDEAFAPPPGRTEVIEQATTSARGRAASRPPTADQDA